MRFTLSSLLVTALATSVYADINNLTTYPDDECGRDLLIDDFRSSRRGVLKIPGETITRQLNLLEADYGQGPNPDSLNYTIDTTAGVIRIVSGPQPVGQDNYWFSKFDPNACFNTTNWHAIAFDLVGPPGGAFTTTLTQKNPDCIDRTPGLSDSDYIPISNYVTLDGTKQPVVMPFADFRRNIAGGAFDLVHLKDWTLNHFLPVGSVWEISNLRLIRPCGPSAPAVPIPPPAASTTALSAAPAATTISAAPAATTTPLPGAGTGTGTGIGTDTDAGTGTGSGTGTGAPATSTPPAEDVQHSSASKTLTGFVTLVFGVVGAFLGAW
ncbi:hypothetical protein PhCBS80983_g02581 [Powellomyces hirtus]|uniref:Uncharacterized protein n=1 Tax=Powellomyces hirtus TaxID=109895 RepID=A0A507E5Y5_9FUNG|nr:hypothetical protein PhCBS80983_g02581 [Powellomyces hirtus]